MLTRMIKKLFKPRSAKKVAESYSSYSDFAHSASDKEKEVVIVQAIKNANKMQRELAGQHR